MSCKLTQATLQNAKCVTKNLFFCIGQNRLNSKIFSGIRLLCIRNKVRDNKFRIVCEGYILTLELTESKSKYYCQFTLPKKFKYIQELLYFIFHILIILSSSLGRSDAKHGVMRGKKTSGNVKHLSGQKRSISLCFVS